MKDFVRLIFFTTVLVGTMVFSSARPAFTHESVLPDTFDLAHIPAPYSFHHFQELISGERISVGGDGDFVYMSNVEREYRGKVSDIDLNGVFFTSPQDGWVVGAKGSIYRTVDRGRNWTRQHSGTKSDLLAITCVNDVRCWGTGDDGIILTTRNGKDWLRLESGVKTSLAAVDFLEDGFGIAVGRSLILKSDDGGMSWKNQNIVGGEDSCNGRSFSSEPLYLTGVTIFNKEMAWVSADVGVARYRSTDGSWEGGCIKEIGPLVGIVTQNGRSVFGIGLDGKNAISEDSGKTWKLHSPPKPSKH